MPLSSGIMVFEVRGGPISMYFRSKFGISLGMHFGDHLDLILTSFWSHFGDLGEHFGDLGGSWEQVGILMDFGSDLGTKKCGPGHGGRHRAAGGAPP